MRLDKILADNTAFSRNDIKKLILKKCVEINGITAKKPNENAEFGDEIKIKGKTIPLREFIYCIVNKPKGVLSATKDGYYNTKTVLDIIPAEFKKKDSFPVGRLDKNTTGLLLVTNNGDLAHKLLSPKFHVKKTYTVTVDGTFDAALAEEITEKFKNGVTLKDGTALKPAELKILSKHKAEITLTEGKFHQIKRMFGLFNLPVEELQRTSFGPLKLPKDLAEGQSRLLTDYELEKLKCTIENNK